MKSQVSFLALISIITSLTQPAWSMEDDGSRDVKRVHASKTDKVQEKRKKPRNSKTKSDKVTPNGKKRKQIEKSADITPKKPSSSKKQKQTDEDEAAALGLLALQDSFSSPKRQAEKENEEPPATLLEDQYKLGIKYLSEKDFQKAASCFEEAAKGGHSKAQGNMGYLYSEGKGVEKDQNKAIHWFKKASKQGSEIAPFQLSLYHAGIGHIRPQKFRKALSLMIQSARGKFPQAQIVVAKVDQVVPEDEENAKGLLAAGLFCLARVSKHGIGIPKQLTNADTYTEIAAELGHAEAQYALGKSMENKDHEKAAFWLKQAAEQKHARAQSLLAVWYIYGIGVKKDAREAMRLFKRAAKQGDSIAQYNLGSYYSFGKRDGQEIIAPQKQKKALNLYLKSARGGHKKAIFIVGSTDLTLPEDPKEVTALLTKGYFNAGCHFDTGLDISQDMVEAQKFYSWAAHLGHEKAQKNCTRLDIILKNRHLFQAPVPSGGRGSQYEEGRGSDAFKGAMPGCQHPHLTPQNFQGALNFCRQKAHQGNESAKAILPGLELAASLMVPQKPVSRPNNAPQNGESIPLPSLPPLGRSPQSHGVSVVSAPKPPPLPPFASGQTLSAPGIHQQPGGNENISEERMRNLNIVNDTIIQLGIEAEKAGDLGKASDCYDAASTWGLLWGNNTGTNKLVHLIGRPGGIIYPSRGEEDRKNLAIHFYTLASKQENQKNFTLAREFYAFTSQLAQLDPRITENIVCSSARHDVIRLDNLIAQQRPQAPQRQVPEQNGSTPKAQGAVPQQNNTQ